MGVEEAKKQYALENHTVDTLLQIIKDNNLTDTVDLVSGGHYDMLFTEKEITTINADLKLAKESGLDVSSVKFFPKEEMIEVSTLFLPSKGEDRLSFL